MEYPVIFPLRELLRHKSPDQVRQILQQNGFTLHQAQPTPYLNPRARGFSEIWFKLAGRGYAVVRIDAQGHSKLSDAEGRRYAIGGAAVGPHGGVPHYHKEWIAAEWFPHYLHDYVRQVVSYDDAGDPVTGAMTDERAKRVHIKR